MLSLVFLETANSLLEGLGLSMFLLVAICFDFLGRYVIIDAMSTLAVLSLGDVERCCLFGGVFFFRFFSVLAFSRAPER